MSARWLHRIAVTAFLGLLARILLWLLVLHPPEQGALLTIALVTLVGPLLLTLRGVLQARRYTMAWSAIVVLIYFVHGITYAAVPGPARWLGALEIALAVVYFTATLMYLRQAGGRSAVSGARRAR